MRNGFHDGKWLWPRPDRRYRPLAAVLWGLFVPLIAYAHPLNIAFYYGARPPHDLIAFRWVVVQPQSRFDPRRFDRHGRRAFAYTSVGELRHVRQHRHFPASCVLGQDLVWHTVIVDNAAAVCRQYYLHRILTPLWRRGYRGFFLDTLDSYRQVLTAPAAIRRQQAGLIRLIRAVKKRYPRARLITNRGFALLPAVHKDLAAVAAESLFDGWNPQTGRYGKVAPATRRRLLGHLRAAQALGLPVIAIDYHATPDSPAAVADARRIMALGITPWVTDHALTALGVGRVRVMPRRILMLYSGPEDAQHTALNWYAAMPLNYLGYSTRIVNVAKGLPPSDRQRRYAGIVTWFESDHIPAGAPVYAWLRHEMRAGTPIAILGAFGFAADPAHLAPLHLRAGRIPPGFIVNRVVFHNPRYMAYETAAVPVPPDNFRPLRARGSRVLLTLRDRAGQREDAAAITPWGGYALSPDVVSYLDAAPGPPDKAPSAWILDPFRFFRRALRLPPMPVPDTTTEAGRRLLMAQIDGDGFANRSWIYRDRGEFAGAVILKDILARYRIPTSASFIVSYLTPHGLFPQDAAALTALARRIAALPWVEVASHTYSHPFNWPALERDPALVAHRGDMRYGYALQVPGYDRFRPQQEVTFAARWLDRHVAPAGKPVRLIQWSGDCDPDAAVLALSYKNHLLNLNGGGATETPAQPFLTKDRGLGIFKGRYFQVYAPMQDENVYTHSWTSPYYYGYVHALQTFRLTDTPRRLKPLDIYYHFYSGARPAGIRALRRVIGWALRQRTDPVFPSRFARIAVDFNRVVVARGTHSWHIVGANADQELRIPVTQGYPRLSQSRGVVGYDRHERARYIHIVPDRRIRLELAPRPPRRVYLHDADARIVRATYRGRDLHLALTGAVPLAFRLGNAQGCTVTDHTRTLPGRRTGPLMSYHLSAHHGHFLITCQ